MAVTVRRLFCRRSVNSVVILSERIVKKSKILCRCVCTVHLLYDCMAGGRSLTSAGSLEWSGVSWPGGNCGNRCGHCGDGFHLGRGRGGPLFGEPAPTGPSRPIVSVPRWPRHWKAIERGGHGPLKMPNFTSVYVSGEDLAINTALFLEDRR